MCIPIARHLPTTTLYLLLGHAAAPPLETAPHVLRDTALKSAIALEPTHLPHGQWKAAGLHETATSYVEIVGRSPVDDAITGSWQWVLNYSGIWLATPERVREEIARAINRHRIALLDAGILDPTLEVYLDRIDPRWQSPGRRRWLSWPHS